MLECTRYVVNCNNDFELLNLASITADVSKFYGWILLKVSCYEIFSSHF